MSGDHLDECRIAPANAELPDDQDLHTNQHDRVSPYPASHTPPFPVTFPPDLSSCDKKH